MAPPADVLVIDIVNADHGEALLMAQARATWPNCRVIALPRDRSYRSSMVFAMGLWSPDRLMMQPACIPILVQWVEQLSAQARVDRMIRDRAADTHHVGVQTELTARGFDLRSGV